MANGINTAHLSYVREKTGHALIGAHQQIPREHIDDPVRSLVMGLPPDLAFRSEGQLGHRHQYGRRGRPDLAGLLLRGRGVRHRTQLREHFEAGRQAYVLRMPSNFIITLAAGTKLICAQAAGSLLTHKRRWEVRSVGNGSKGELVVRLGLPPVRPDRPPPPDPGMIPLTIPKIKRLLNARTARRCPGGSLSHWDAWTRLLSFCDDADLRDADPDTLRYRVWHIPRPARPARTHANASSRSAPTGPGKTRSSPAGGGCAPCQHPPDRHEPSRQRERRTVPAPSEPLRTRHTGHHRASVADSQTDTRP